MQIIVLGSELMARAASMSTELRRSEPRARERVISAQHLLRLRNAAQAS